MLSRSTWLGQQMPFDRLNRREFITLVGGAAAAWPLAARAQQHSGRIWRIAFLAHRYESFYDALFQGLRELGYLEGRNLIVERRYAEGHAERFDEFAAEIVRANIDLVVVITTPAALAVRKVSTTIPIVHPAAIDPVGTGLVASLAHPGGNVTGLAVLNAELSAKRLELLREILPQISLVALLWNSANPANTLAWKETESAARALGIGLRSDEVRDVKDFDSAFAAIAEQRPDALLVLQDALTLQYRKQIVEFALRTRLPSMFVGKEWVQDGGLMSYGDRLPERYRRAAQIIDRILKGGEKPADIPVDQPTIFELAVNLKTAKAIGISIPPAFLTRADEVIE
jgi:putative ABC transport system substrate-binding protein